MRIALASSNGDIVDLHLGKAVSLVIYDVVDNDFDFVETRKLAIDKDAKHQGGDVIQECNDCDVIISTMNSWFSLFIFLTSFIYDSHDIIIMEDLCTIVLGVLIALVIFSVCG